MRNDNKNSQESSFAIQVSPRKGWSLLPAVSAFNQLGSLCRKAEAYLSTLNRFNKHLKACHSYIHANTSNYAPSIILKNLHLIKVFFLMSW